MTRYDSANIIRSGFSKTILILTILSCLALSGCRENPYIISMLDKADSLLGSRPDSTLNIIRMIDPDKITGAGVKARYSLLHSIALDKNYIDLKTDSIISPAVEYYGKSGSDLQKAATYYYLGRIYCNGKDKENAIKYLSEAELYARKTTDYYLCALIYNTLGNLYYHQNIFSDAISMYHESGKYFEKAGDIKRKANALSYIGKTYYLLNNDDSTMLYYNMAREIYKEVNGGARVLRINSGMSDKLINSQKYDEAIELLREGYRLYNNDKIPIRDYPAWAKIYLHMNEFDKSREFAFAALEQKYATDRIKAGLYVILSDSYIKQNNYKKAYEYSKLYSKHFLAASLDEKEQFIQEIKERYDKEKLQTSYINLQKENKYMKAIYFLIIVLVVVSGLLIIIRQRAKRKILQERYERDLNEANNYMEAMKENFSQLNDKYKTLKSESGKNDDQTVRFLKSFEQRITQMKNIMDIAYTSESKPIHFYNKFKEYINTGAKTDDAFEDLQYVVNAKYYGIIDYLKEEYPVLSKTDLDLCSMLCFGFSPNAIRLIYGHTNLESIFQKRKKLREKMNIPTSIQLETFIKKLKGELQERHTL